MLSEHNMSGSTEDKPGAVSGRGKTGRSVPADGQPDASVLDTGAIHFPVLGPKLSTGFLARHLAEVASLARSQGDLRMARHLVDVAYDLATEK